MSEETSFYTPDTLADLPVPVNSMTPPTLADQFVDLLDEMTFTELLQASVLMEDVVKTRATQERERLVEQAKVVSAYLQVQPQELFVVTKTKAPKSASKVVKFRHPEDPNKTWAGKGRTPDWVKELTSAGTPLESLAA